MATTTMTQTQTLPSEPTTLNYYLEVKDGGIVQTYPGTAFEKRRKHVPHHVDVRDLRSMRKDFTLDTAGFELIDYVSAEKDFTDPERIKEIYYPEVERIMKEKYEVSECRPTLFTANIVSQAWSIGGDDNIAHDKAQHYS